MTVNTEKKAEPQCHAYLAALTAHEGMTDEVVARAVEFHDYLRDNLPHCLFDELVSGMTKQLFHTKIELCGDRWAGRGFIFETLEYLGEFQDSDDIDISRRN